MSFNGTDFGFVGQAYEAADPYQDRQRLMNWYVEVSQDDKSKTPTALLGCPGLNPIFQAVIAQGRGGWVLPGGNQALVVFGNTLYVGTVTVPATQTSIAQFSWSAVGTLLTNSGPVVIRDNGAGGYAVIVDGPFGYYYRIAGAGSYVFNATTTATNTVVAVSAPFPSGIIVGSAISGANIPVGATITATNINGLSFTMSAAATGSGATTITETLASFAQITDQNFLGSDRISFIDGWLGFNQPGTQNFYTNAPTPYTLLFDGTFFAKNDSSTDNVITHHEQNREWWIIGERHTEVWTDQGGAGFAFARIPGVTPQIGCAAKHSIARLGSNLVWLGKSERGENTVVTSDQYNFKPISTVAVENAISSYPLVSDAIGYTYLEAGHLFYVLTFPTADATWVYDNTTQMWHQRGSWDVTNGVFHRHRSNFFINFQDLRLVGDYQSGQLHQMSRSVYTDAGQPLVALRRTPIVWKRETRERVFQASLQIDFSPGVGLQVGQGSNPQFMLRWSNDYGATWGNQHFVPVGKAGRYKNRAKINRVGMSRGRVFEGSYSEPTNRDIVGATLFWEPESQEDAA